MAWGAARPHLTGTRIITDDDPMRASFADFLRKLREQLLGPGGKLALKAREDILDGRIVEAPLNEFVVRVRANASSITQGHVDELKASGLGEDEIFEATVCAAFVAGQERYQAVMKLLAKVDDAP